MCEVSSMKTRLLTTAAAALLVAMAAPAAAQTLPPPPVRPVAQTADADEGTRPYSRWHLGLLSGAQQVERTGVTGGGEFGVRLRRGLHLVVEGGWMSDVVTKSRIDEINGYVDYVRTAYPASLPVTGEIDGTAIFGMLGFRMIPDGKPVGESNGVRPYVMASAGIARVEYKPAFTVEGQAVSGGGISAFGVTLGRDLLGTTSKFAYSGGAGLILGDTWYLDLGVRITRIHTTDHPTTVKRLVIGMGRRF
jgi:opacity protein-like surface antigen